MPKKRSNLPAGLTYDAERDQYRIDFLSRHTRKRGEWPEKDRRYRERLPVGTSKTKAIEYHTKVKEDDRLGKLTWLEEKAPLHEPSKRWTLDVFLVEKYLDHIERTNKPATVKRKAQSLRKLRQTFGDMLLEDIDREAVQTYQSARLLEGVRRATVNRDFDTLWHLLRYAWEEGVIREMPRWRRLRLNENDGKAIRYLTYREADLLFTHIATLDQILWRVFPVFMIYTGLRYAEAAQLLWTDIDFASNVVFVRHDTKSSKQREVPMLPEVTEHLMLLPRLCEHVFAYEASKASSRYHEGTGTFVKTLPMHGELGARSNGPRRYPWDVPELLEQGLRINPHMFRHTFGAWNLRAGRQLYQVSQWMGHSTTEITMKHYGHIQTERFQEAMEGRQPKLYRPFWDEVAGSPSLDVYREAHDEKA